MEAKSRFIQQTSHLQLLTPEPLLIPACRGGIQASFPYMEDVFTGYMDTLLKNKIFAKEQPQTKETPVIVYEICNDRDLNDVYRSLKIPYELLSFESQEQVKMFAIEHSMWLADNNARTFFLCSEIDVVNKKDFSSFSVSVDHQGDLKLDRHKHDHRPWLAKRKHRFVFPSKGLLVP